MKNALTFSVALVGIIALLALHQTLPGDTLFAALSKVQPQITAKSKEVISKRPEDRTAKTIPPQFSLVAAFNRQIKDLGAKTDKTPDDLKTIDRLKLQRSQLMPDLIKADPNLAFALVLPEIDQPLNVRNGIIDVFITDDFEHPENSKVEYFLTQGRTREQFFPANTGPDGLALMSNTKVNIPTAYRFGDLVVADARRANLVPLEPLPVPDSIGDQKTLVLLIDFLDSGPRPFTPEQAHDLIFNGQFQNFYHEQSYGKVSFSGEVMGWYTVPVNGCLVPWLSNQYGSNLILQNNIDLTSYNRLLWVVRGCAGGASSVGKSNVSINGNSFYLSQTWVGLTSFDNNAQQPFSWTNLDYLLSHELGHALGLWHANGWDCGTEKLYGDCANREYGNLFDGMGYGQLSLHFTAFAKKLLGWVDGNDIVSVGESGRHFLNPLETTDGTARLAEIKNPLGGWTFYVEYRQGLGFDIKLNNPSYVYNTNGLLVNYLVPSESNLNPRLLDMKPSSLDWWGQHGDLIDASLNSTNTFDDPGSGVTIGPVINNSPTGIVFDVSMRTPVCVRQNPFFHYPVYHLQTLPGNSSFVGLNFGNADSPTCGGSFFDVTYDLPLGWTQVGQSETMSLLPGENGLHWLIFRSPDGVTPSVYHIQTNLFNTSSGLNNSVEIEVEVISRIEVVFPNGGEVLHYQDPDGATPNVWNAQWLLGASVSPDALFTVQLKRQDGTLYGFPQGATNEQCFPGPVSCSLFFTTYGQDPAPGTYKMVISTTVNGETLSDESDDWFTIGP